MIYGKRRYVKLPVQVTAIHTRTGFTVPVRLTMGDGRSWELTCRGDPRNAVCRKTGGAATLFPVLLKTGKGEVAKDLFRGKDGIWFVEAHEPPREGEVVYDPLPYTQGLAYSGYDYDPDEC